MFNYEPMTEEEVQKERYNLMDDGEYDAVIDRMEPRVAASGNNVVGVTLSVYDKNGNKRLIFDCLVLTRTMMWKFKHLCDAAGFSKEYLDKTFSLDMALKKMVKIRISTQEGGLISDDKLKGKPEGSRYPTKNVVEDYLARNGSNPIHIEPSKGHADLELNDDIPF